MSSATPAPVTPVPSPKRRPKTKRPKIQGSANWLTRLIVVTVVVTFLIPTIGLFITSFRPRVDSTSSGWWTALFSPFDAEWTLQGYREVLDAGMGNAFINSIVIAVPATLIPLLIAAMAAYAFTFMKFPGRDVIFLVVVGLLVVPLQVAFIPLLQLFGQFELVGTFPAVWLAHTGFGMPLAIYLLRTYMATVPHSLLESAQIDGASHFQIFWRLLLPISVPALASFAIFQFLWVWNDLLVALLFVGAGENETVTLRLSSLIGQYGQRWDLLAPGAFISLSLPLIVFLFLQRYFVRGMTAGSVKG
ncbi:carbohydrate ABC transporter permease [Flaviflexus huanghaiensis]|uniref:carbohydrate ABC transporter permease n=1 Tax=Flaviflexus huanghaiensis TaxID=1111473 RepID=UPI0015F8C497|nr:carbohydrate ABC transporter permease [Flaviflexus huanghaiensis]